MNAYLTDDANLVRSLLPPTEQPTGGDEALFLGYAVLMRAKGLGTTAEDVHDTWAAWALTRNPQHPAIVPFDAPPAEPQAMDLPYVRAIHAAAKQRTADSARSR